MSNSLTQPSNSIGNPKSYLHILITVFIIGMLAHGFRYFNSSLSFDGLTALNHHDLDSLLKILSGRIFGFVNCYWRGHIMAPWLIGFIGLFWASISCYLLVKLLHIQSRWIIYACCGLVVTHSSIILTHASFMHEVDFFFLSQLLVILNVYLLEKLPHRKSRWVCPALYLLSCSLYQGYISTALTLGLILMIKGILDGTPLKQVFIKGGKLALYVGIGCMAYLALLLAVKFTTGSLGADSYNSPLNVQNTLENDIPRLLGFAHYHFWRVIRYPFAQHDILIFIFNVVTSLIAFTQLYIQIKRGQYTRASIITLILLIACMPFAINAIAVACGGNSQELLDAAFTLYPIFLLMVIDRSWQQLKQMPAAIAHSLNRWGKTCTALIAFTIFSQVIFANQMYMRKELMSHQTRFFAQRIVADLEKLEGYQVGSSELIFVGLPDNSKTLARRAGFEHTERGYGSNFQTAIDWRWANQIHAYFSYILAYPANIGTPSSWPEDDAVRDIVRQMPCFPQAGYIKMIEGKIYIKLSKLEPTAEVLDELKAQAGQSPE